MSETAASQPNHLIGEKSPYLLQHAYNPVDWHAWGEDAFARARAEDKPILVSIGYSTCHWCHVMEKESFSNAETAALMNRSLINIKVDREERPDVDKIYMTALTAMTGSGGWPLNVFLTPDLKPFYGGTYFPPDDRYARGSWPDLIRRISDAWANPEGRKKILESADGLTNHLKEFLDASSVPGELSLDFLGETFHALESVYDPDSNGFGGAPKFPMPVYHQFLQAYYDVRGGEKYAEGVHAKRMSLDTLKSMARGGIYDQIGGGFHRYSTDSRWHVPHFEKMLYDNAQLAVNYLHAYRLSGDEFFARVARETLDYILRDMTHPQGGFYSAEDADSLPARLAGKVSGETHEHKIEGAFYVWTQPEILQVLGEGDGKIACKYWGVQEKGNVKEDPHGELGNQNVLFVAASEQEMGGELGKNSAEFAKLLNGMRDCLFKVRSERPRPHLDDKVLTSWNGLALSAFAKAYQILGEVRYLDAAEKAARFVRKELYDENTRQLFRRWRDGERKVKAVSDDYAFLIQGLLDLYEADFDSGLLLWAIQLTEDLNAKFFDAEKGGFYMTETAHDQNLLVRAKEDYDNVEPSASSIACLNLLRLAAVTGRLDFSAAAEKTLKYFAAVLKEQPRALPQMAVALQFFLRKPAQIVITGDKNSAEGRAMLKEIWRKPIQNRVLFYWDQTPALQAFEKAFAFLGAAKTDRGKATVYVCVQQTCQLPASNAEELKRAFEGAGLR